MKAIRNMETDRNSRVTLKTIREIFSVKKNEKIKFGKNGKILDEKILEEILEKEKKY